jgi:hypothetical protein
MARVGSKGTLAFGTILRWRWNKRRLAIDARADIDGPRRCWEDFRGKGAVRRRRCCLIILRRGFSITLTAFVFRIGFIFFVFS